jgi:hypothetical protein
MLLLLLLLLLLAQHHRPLMHLSVLSMRTSAFQVLLLCLYSAVPPHVWHRHHNIATSCQLPVSEKRRSGQPVIRLPEVRRPVHFYRQPYPSCCLCCYVNTEQAVRG